MFAPRWPVPNLIAPVNLLLNWFIKLVLTAHKAKIEISSLAAIIMAINVMKGGFNQKVCFNSLINVETN